VEFRKMKTKGIGLDVKQPAKACSDKNCPFHGQITARGRMLTGMVTSDKMSLTATVSWVRRLYVPKFERYEKRKSKVKAHNPECLNAKKGDLVRIVETKPLSKTKHFVIVEIMGSQSNEEFLKQESVQENPALPAQGKKKIIGEEEKTKPKSEEQ